MGWMAAGVALALALVATTRAHAVPKVGAQRPDVKLVDAWDRYLEMRGLGAKPVLVVYEDKDSANDNQALKDELAKLAKGDRYKKAIALVAVADVSAYDFWPVKGFVKDAIQKESKKFGTTIYCDWDGSARRALDVVVGESSVVLYGRDGKVVFARSGALSADERRALIELLRRQVEGGA